MNKLIKIKNFKKAKKSENTSLVQKCLECTSNAHDADSLSQEVHDLKERVSTLVDQNRKLEKSYKEMEENLYMLKFERLKEEKEKEELGDALEKTLSQLKNLKITHDKLKADLAKSKRK